MLLNMFANVLFTKQSKIKLMKKLFISFIVLVLFASCESWSGCGVISDKKPIQEGYTVKYYLILTDDRGNEHKVEVTKKEYNERIEGEIICQNP